MLSTVYEYRVKWGDTDAAGIVYFPNFYKWMDQSTAELFRSIGFPLSRLFSEEKVGTPLVETHCEHKFPAIFDDLVRIETTIAEVGDKSFKVTHEMYIGEILIARGYEIRVWVDVSQGKIKAKSIPENIREAMLNHHVRA